MNLPNLEMSRDGLTLRGFFNKPNSSKYDIAILFYGFAGSLKTGCDLLPNLAAELEKNGIATLQFDFSGHGYSDGNISNMTIYNELEDANAILNYVLSLKEVNRVYLIGHSQGGVIASMMAGFYQDKIDKLILINPAATLVDDARLGTCMGKNYDPVNIPNSVNLPMFELNSFYFRTAKFINIFEVAQNFKKNALILAGENDEVVNNYASKHFHAVMNNSQLKILANGNHNMDQVRRLVNELSIDFLN